METSQSISHNQHNTKQCEEVGRESFLGYCLSAALVLLPLDVQARMNVKQIWNALKSSKNLNYASMILLALAARAVAVLKVFISTRRVNARLFVGMALVGIITPLADVFYTWLPAGRVPESEWYYESWYWLFLCLGPYIALLSFCVGTMFILLPNAFDKRSYFFIVPIGFALAKIVWLWQVTNHDEYLQVPPIAFFIYSFGFVALMLVLSNYLAWRKYHRADSFPKRMDGLCQIADMNDPVQKAFATTWQEMKLKNY